VEVIRSAAGFWRRRIDPCSGHITPPVATPAPQPAGSCVVAVPQPARHVNSYNATIDCECRTFFYSRAPTHSLLRNLLTRQTTHAHRLAPSTTPLTHTRRGRSKDVCGPQQAATGTLNQHTAGRLQHSSLDFFLLRILFRSVRDIGTASFGHARNGTGGSGPAAVRGAAEGGRR
jgi:hypothetical protein